MAINVFTFSGNLGGDAETRYTPNGTAVANFSVAAKSGYGEHEKTFWVGCQLWGKRAEGGLVQYLVKGQKVTVTGELSVRDYQRKDGTSGTAVELRVHDVDLGGRADDSGSQGGNYAPQAQQQRTQAPQQQGQQRPAYDDFDDQQIPF